MQINILIFATENLYIMSYFSIKSDYVGEKIPQEAKGKGLYAILIQIKIGGFILQILKKI